jgi:phosphodiesterase/alkaline phosphatase D-like protein
VISGVSATPVSNAATIAWTTDEVANSRVDYGTDMGSLALHVSGASFTLAHSLQLTGLTPLTQYYYKITSVDPSGNPTVEPSAGDPPSFMTLAHTSPPVISAVTATLAPSGVEATVAWTTDEAATSVVLYGTDSENLNLTTEVAGLVTSHSVPLTGLASGTTYYYRVRSADAYGVEATFPVAPAAPFSFSTPQEACFIDATVADFSLGDAGTGTYVEEKADGEVVLKAALSTDFSGSALPPGWVVTHWGSGGGYAVGGGVLTVDNYRVMPDPYGVGPGHSVEFMGTFGTAEAYQHVGFGGGGVTAPDVFNSAPWAMFSTGAAGGVLQVRTWPSGGAETNQTIPGTWLGAPHLYRVDWADSKVDFYIDGSLVATHTTSITGLMRPAISDGAGNSAPVTVDWLRVTPFAPSGTFTSRVFSRSAVSTWHTVTWTADTPGATGLAVGVRTGNTPAPDASWTGFATVASGEELARHSRYVQYQAELSTPDVLTTPVLRDLTISCEPYNDTAAPAITAVAATPNPNGTQATVTWTTDEVANAQVDYGTAPDALSSNVTSALFFTAHSLPLTGLTPGTTYYYRVTSADPSSNSATSPVPAEAPLSFATPAHTTPPVISAVVATPDPLGTQATVTWTTDEAATSVVHYGLVEVSLDLTATVGGLVTAHSALLTGLAPGSTYYFRVESADAFGNSATSPAPPADPLSFATPATPCPTDATAADFALGTLDANTAIALSGDGEVVLKTPLYEEFSGTSLPPSWPSGPWATGGTVTVSGGAVTVDGGHTYTETSFGPGRSLEFVATYRAGNYQNIGFSADGAFSSPWVVIGMGGATDGVYARTHAGTETRLSTTTLGSPHLYRIDWNAGNFVFYVDGNQLTTVTLNVTSNMVVQVSDLNVGGNALSLDWVRVGPYPSPGTFTSRVFDHAGPTDWSTMTWNASTPANTGVSVSVRTSTTIPPEAGWTPFAPVANGASVGENARYLQYQATLTTSDGSVTPSLADIAFACTPGPDLTWPVISNVVATAALGGEEATITWDSDEFANSRVDYGTNPSALTQA